MPTKAELEGLKLIAETRHINAQLQKVELETASLEREHRDHAASANQARVYPFVGSVTNASVQACMATLATWSRRNPGEDMTIVFNSPGGSVIDGLALYDFIDQLKRDGHRIVTVGRGMVASMGGVLLQAGSHRVIGYNAHMLVHEVSTGMIGKFSEIEDEVAFCKKLQARLLDILAERSTLTARQIASHWKRKDWWLSATETVDRGFADEIGQRAVITYVKTHALAEDDWPALQECAVCGEPRGEGDEYEICDMVPAAHEPSHDPSAVVLCEVCVVTRDLYDDEYGWQLVPYIAPEERVGLDALLEVLAARVATQGQFNYALTYLARGFVARHGGKYDAHAAAVAGLECAKLEHYRTRTAYYENVKRARNGDVFLPADTTAGGW